MRTTKTSNQTGHPESSLGAQSLCWFCHVAAHFVLSLNRTETISLVLKVNANEQKKKNFFKKL